MPRTSASARESRAISVAHVTTVSESLELLLADQLAAIRDAGYSVCGISAPGETRRLSSRGIRHHAIPFVRSSALTPLADLRSVGQLVRLFRHERFTIVHTHTAKADLYAAVAARLAGVPIVVTTLHGFLFHDLTPWKRRRLFAAAAKVGMRAADAVLSQSEEDVETAIRDRICPAQKISVLGNGIDLARFDPDRLPAGTRGRMRRELGIPEDAVVVGFVGRLVAEKGVHELLAAMRLVNARFPSCHAVLIGGADTAKHDAVDAITPSERIHLTGYREDLPELYAAMDVSILPSHREGFPRTVMEAAAMGLPVIATDIRGCRSAVIHRRSGILVPVKDAAALADAICELVASRELRVEQGAAGRALAIREFDQRRVFARVLETYDHLLERIS